MQVFRHLPMDRSLFEGGCVATIGNFDGVHRGHQTVLDRCREVANDRPVVAITLEPQPLEFFAPDKAPPRLTRLREKLIRLEQAGADAVLVLRFNKQLAGLGPQAFIEKVFVRGLNAQHLIIGDDFRFGAKRAGDFALLQKLAPDYGYQVEDTQSCCVGSLRISSTAIRDSLASGDLAHAEELLGRPYSICGTVAHGNKTGRELGYPTANIHLGRLRTAADGIFAVNVLGAQQGPLPGVASLGTRPAVGDDEHFLLEAHIFDYAGNLYGQHLEVQFVERLRGVENFDSLDALIVQMDKDSIRAREILGV